MPNVEHILSTLDSLLKDKQKVAEARASGGIINLIIVVVLSAVIALAVAVILHKLNKNKAEIARMRSSEEIRVVRQQQQVFDEATEEVQSTLHSLREMDRAIETNIEAHALSLDRQARLLIEAEEKINALQSWEAFEDYTSRRNR